MITSIIGSIVFFLASILYVLLVLGLPYGEFAMGGKYKVMPKEMRIVCAFSVIIQWFAIMILLQTASIIPLIFPFSVTKGLCIFFAVYLILNSVMNGFSRSKKERMFVTPLSIITAICYWITVLTV